MRSAKISVRYESEVLETITPPADQIYADAGQPIGYIVTESAHIGYKARLWKITMYNTFNMGIGMVLAVDSADVDKVLAAVKAAGETGYVIGEVKAGEKGVTVC